MPYVGGGDVVPSFLQVETTKDHHDGLNFNNYALRIGEVKKLIYPDDKESRSAKFIEYHVLVQQRSNGTGNAKIYRNCLLMNPLAGLADRAHFTLRFDESKDREKNGLGLGSKVFLMCVNGETNQSYIIGGARDQTDEKDKKIKDLGHHLYFVFNGVSFFIDKDGQLVVTYGGKTNADGKKNDDAKDDQVGSTIKFGKDGAIQLADKDAKNAITIDHANKKVTIARDEAFELGEATDAMLLGQSFRDAQKQMNNKVKGYMKAVKTLLTQAGGQLTTAGGAIAGPFMAAAAGPSLVTAAQMLIQAATIMDNVAQAFDDFEQSAGQKNSFLSKKNKAD